MQIQIDFLRNQQEHVTALGKLWYHLLGKRWPDASPESATEILRNRMNINRLPLTMIALINDTCVGMCSLWETEAINPILGPWLGTLVVEPQQ